MGCLTMKPKLRARRIPFHGGRRDIQDLRGFIDGETAEKPQFGNSPLSSLEPGEAVQSVVQRSQIHALPFPLCLAHQAYVRSSLFQRTRFRGPTCYESTRSRSVGKGRRQARHGKVCACPPLFKRRKDIPVPRRVQIGRGSRRVRLRGRDDGILYGMRAFEPLAPTINLLIGIA